MTQIPHDQCHPCLFILRRQSGFFGREFEVARNKHDRLQNTIRLQALVRIRKVTDNDRVYGLARTTGNVACDLRCVSNDLDAGKTVRSQPQQPAGSLQNEDDDVLHFAFDPYELRHDLRFAAIGFSQRLAQ